MHKGGGLHLHLSLLVPFVLLWWCLVNTQHLVGVLVQYSCMVHHSHALHSGPCLPKIWSQAWAPKLQLLHSHCAVKSTSLGGVWQMPMNLEKTMHCTRVVGCIFTFLFWFLLCFSGGVWSTHSTWLEGCCQTHAFCTISKHCTMGWWFAF